MNENLRSAEIAKKAATIGLTGGGTAGHVWPHFALFDDERSPICQAWKAGQLKVVYFGSDSGMERQLVDKTMEGRWNYVPLSTGKLRRYFDWRNFTDIFRIFLGFFQALSELRKHGVSLLFSKGGYVAAPVVWAAWVLRIPVVIHESDVTPALATKLGFPFCRKMITAFKETASFFPKVFQSRIQNLGLPLRVSLFSADKIAAKSFFGIASTKPVMLVFGGSLGAEVLNTIVRQNLGRLLEKYEIIHIVGKGKAFEPELKNVSDRLSYHQYEFLSSEMKYVYAVTDFAFCRAGASSLFELAAARIPMILVPLDLNQSRGDQIVNAKVFEKAGWAVVVREAQLSSEELLGRCSEVASNLEAFRKRLENAPSADAALRVSELIWSLVTCEGIQSHGQATAGTF